MDPIFFCVDLHTISWNFVMYYIVHYNAFIVYCCKLAPGTVSLTSYSAQGDDSKHCTYCSTDIAVQSLYYAIFGNWRFVGMDRVISKLCRDILL